MSRRDTAAALILATAALGLFTLTARGQEVGAGAAPYASGAVEIAGEVIAVEDQRFTLRDDQGRKFQVRAEGLRDISRNRLGDIDLEIGERLTVRGHAGAPLLNVNMIQATALSPAREAGPPHGLADPD